MHTERERESESESEREREREGLYIIQFPLRVKG